mmetsp:Transcript_72940/g.200218  ORF Transcript_72940/g.200218 Transcript_72940/m.200218 type:complete len:249 (-) Transcript_72940:738-1484(-)
MEFAQCCLVGQPRSPNIKSNRHRASRRRFWKWFPCGAFCIHSARPRRHLSRGGRQPRANIGHCPFARSPSAAVPSIAFGGAVGRPCDAAGATSDTPPLPPRASTHISRAPRRSRHRRLHHPRAACRPTNISPHKCARSFRPLVSPRSFRPARLAPLVSPARLVLTRLLDLHLAARHPRGVHRAQRGVRLLRGREADEAKALAPARLLVHGHLRASHRAVLRELASQVLVVELIVLAAPHLANDEEVCA